LPWAGKNEIRKNVGGAADGRDARLGNPNLGERKSRREEKEAYRNRES